MQIFFSPLHFFVFADTAHLSGETMFNVPTTMRLFRRPSHGDKTTIYGSNRGGDRGTNPKNQLWVVEIFSTNLQFRLVDAKNHPHMRENFEWPSLASLSSSIVIFSIPIMHIIHYTGFICSWHATLKKKWWSLMLGTSAT